MRTSTHSQCQSPPSEPDSKRRGKTISLGAQDPGAQAGGPSGPQAATRGLGRRPVSPYHHSGTLKNSQRRGTQLAGQTPRTKAGGACRPIPPPHNVLSESASPPERGATTLSFLHSGTSPTLSHPTEGGGATRASAAQPDQGQLVAGAACSSKVLQVQSPGNRMSVDAQASPAQSANTGGRLEVHRLHEGHVIPLEVREERNNI